ncbi:hypothetical protein [Streptomyces sp. AC627_RSS907]|uniref:hypothetical protein n=1 Tax=Streptomyces sp. AC627_RSS907 TaxID=2823684 RepID=UPI001C2280DF|nr:hypothetical protein [Streptomyces sp. AC627_RSS907]
MTRRRACGESVEQIQPDLVISVEQAHADLTAMNNGAVPEPRTQAEALRSH